MNSSDRPQPTLGPGDRPTSTSPPLKAYVERKATAVAAAAGPTMAKILGDPDHHRQSRVPTTEDIAYALPEGRREQSTRDGRGGSS
jgi:hypothetical protein